MRKPIIYFLIVLVGIIGLTWALTSSESCKLKKSPSIHQNTDNQDGEVIDSTGNLTEEEFRDENDDRLPPETDVDADDSEVIPLEGDEEDLRGNDLEPNETEDSNESTGGAYSKGSGDYLVIAGAYTIKANAEKSLARVRDLGYPNAEIVQFDFSDYYSVCVARYELKSDANSVANSLKSRHSVNAYVHKKRAKKQ